MSWLLILLAMALLSHAISCIFFGVAFVCVRTGKPEDLPAAVFAGIGGFILLCVTLMAVLKVGGELW